MKIVKELMVRLIDLTASAMMQFKVKPPVEQQLYTMWKLVDKRGNFEMTHEEVSEVIPASALMQFKAKPG